MDTGAIKQGNKKQLLNFQHSYFTIGQGNLD
ncbi:MAG: hypothetical protein JWM28_1804 [Chitinophagaceae bacterium]|nr:hypothetical protein [Chitinophagaceae bacterium]